MNNKEYISAIDLGSSQISIIECELFEQQEAQLRHNLSVPSLGIQRGYIKDKEQVKKSLQQLIENFQKQSKRKSSELLLSMGGVGLVSQYLRISLDLRKNNTEITNNDIQNVWERAELLFSGKYPNKKILHLIPISYRVDDKDVLGSPLGMFGGKIEAKIIVITVPEHQLETALSTLAELGIQVEDTVAAPLCDASSCLNYQQKKQGVVLVNIGAETTQISTFEQGTISSVKVVPLGSSDISNDLALGLQIPITQAHKIKYGKDKTFPEKKVREIINARMIDIIESVEQHLKSIKKNRLLPAGVVWTGNGSLLPELHSYAKSILHIPSCSVNLSEVPVSHKKNIHLSPGFSTAYGLCLLETKEQASKQNFSFKNLKKNFLYWLSQLKP